MILELLHPTIRFCMQKNLIKEHTMLQTHSIYTMILEMRLAKYLLENHPILIWSFFFGLIIASIYFVGKQIIKWHLATFLGIFVGAIIAYYITTIPASSVNDSSYFLFFAGALAICAMILPGISGSFILVILGAYKTLSDAIHDFDFKKLALFVGGAIVGLLSFSHVLKWLFKKYHNLTLALLTGFIIGSLNKVWPWKKVLTWRENSEGLQVPFLEESISPFSFDGDNKIVVAISFMVIGFLVIFLLEKLGAKTND